LGEGEMGKDRRRPAAARLRYAPGLRCVCVNDGARSAIGDARAHPGDARAHHFDHARCSICNGSQGPLNTIHLHQAASKMSTQPTYSRARVEEYAYRADVQALLQARGGGVYNRL
jgi:hypothetical protein